MLRWINRRVALREGCWLLSGGISGNVLVLFPRVDSSPAAPNTPMTPSPCTAQCAEGF